MLAHYSKYAKKTLYADKNDDNDDDDDDDHDNVSYSVHCIDDCYRGWVALQVDEAQGQEAGAAFKADKERLQKKQD